MARKITEDRCPRETPAPDLVSAVNESCRAPSRSPTQAASVRAALRRHPWAIGLLESRTNPGPATLKHHDAVIGTLRGAGFSVAMTAHAYALIDAFVYGFALSEASLPINGPDTISEVAGQMMEQYSAEEYPHLVEFSVEHVMQPGYDYGEEFEFGLGIVLDGLARSLTSG
jgi:hypothetical protein